LLRLGTPVVLSDRWVGCRRRSEPSSSQKHQAITLCMKRERTEKTPNPVYKQLKMIVEGVAFTK
jgi:hypothetical protein